MSISVDKQITIIGVGRLGLCAALVMERKGYKILGVDIFPQYCEQINNKTLKSLEPNVETYLRESKNFRASTSIEEGLHWSNLIYIFVDTPTGVAEKSYDHSKLSRVLEQINDKKPKNKHVVVGCTVLPGFLARVGSFLLRDCENTSLSYNPEFIAQGTIIRDFLNPDMVLIGEGTKEAGDIIEGLYKSIVDNNPRICRMTVESAEITKLSLNCFITMKIAFCNMIGDIADRSNNANKYDILAAVGSDSRVGNKYLKPGYGFGGPCFPRDNRALGWYAMSVGVDPILAHAADNSNKLHFKLMLEKELAKEQKEYKFENVAYKENCAVPIIEESQKLLLAVKLAEQGKSVIIRDRHLIIREVQREYGNLFKYETTDEKEKKAS